MQCNTAVYAVMPRGCNLEWILYVVSRRWLAPWVWWTDIKSSFIILPDVIPYVALLKAARNKCDWRSVAIREFMPSCRARLIAEPADLRNFHENRSQSSSSIVVRPCVRYTAAVEILSYITFWTFSNKTFWTRRPGPKKPLCSSCCYQFSQNP